MLSSENQGNHIILYQPLMSRLECFGCLNARVGEVKQTSEAINASSPSELSKTQTTNEVNSEKSSIKVTFNLQEDQPNDENQEVMLFRCDCCQNIYCRRCCAKHMQPWYSQQETRTQSNDPNIQNPPQYIDNHDRKSSKTQRRVHIVCQQCEDNSSIKYCSSCQQYLCERCSFKIHNKGKRAKHELQEDISKVVQVKSVIILTKDIATYLKQIFIMEQGKKFQESLEEFVQEELRLNSLYQLFWIEQSMEKQFEELTAAGKLIYQLFEPDTTKLEDLTQLSCRYPFLTSAKLVITSKDTNYHLKIVEQADKALVKRPKLEVCYEYKKKNQPIKHERVNSEKIAIKHNKNISNFSNVSAISKVENQSIISNEQSDLFESNEHSLNITLNQNSSILMMGALSDWDKEQKEDKKLLQIKENDRQSLGHHRIYSIREENSHASANNLSTSTQNSIRKRNKKWPIPYFQPFRIPKHERGPRYNAELYLRDLAEKGILMIRRQKAEQFLFDSEISRNFVRNIGEKQIEYLAYIIDFLSVECLAWVIESIKQDKMTPNEKLIQSRLKQSFDLKVNMKLWDSIIKYFQSTQYEQDYLDNTKIRYVPKICIEKYGEEFLLEFQERKWPYEDQQLLDEEEEEWKQFKKLITDYFNGKSQITGGRYGCVQYVKLNGPKPLRKCSLGKISMYVQQAINKGIIRYHKTLLVSNSENNNSTCSNLNAGIDNIQQLAQLQKDIKIMSIQMALIDMFLEVPPNTPISLAQIPLNLKKGIIFEYNLVELGFPKLKNILNTLNDKLILDTTKTHITYQINTNGSEAIEKLRNKLLEASQKLLSHVLSFISYIVVHYQTITLQELYGHLQGKLGFIFDYKIYKTPDFYQFTLYYCAQIINVQFVQGMFVAYSKYPQYPVYQIPQQTQTHRSTYSQDLYPTYGMGYQQNPVEDYSRTSQKKYSHFSTDQTNKYAQLRVPSMGNEDYEAYSNTANTPKFNNRTQNEKKKFNSIVWKECLEETLKRQDKVTEQYYEPEQQNCKDVQHIVNMNFLDDHDNSDYHPPETVIENQCSQQNNPNQLYIFDKINPNRIDQMDYFGAEEVDVDWGDRKDKDSEKKSGKAQHNRVKSTNQPLIKHERGYSTTIPRK